jgi:ferric-dicitrate binding protein FerR (iron transport regulator)
MNERAPKASEGNGDDLGALLSRVRARERPRPAAEAAAFAALHAQWLEHTAARRRRRLMTRAIATAASLAAVAVAFLWLQGPAPSAPPLLASVENVEGTDITWRNDRTQAQPLGTLQGLAEGQRLATGPGSRIALRWHNGGSLRVDERSRLEFVSPSAVRLTAGNLYFDSVAGSSVNRDSAPELAVQTPAGEIFHIGTQFMVRVESNEVVLSVREGQVKVITSDGSQLVVDANQELDLRADGIPNVTAIDGHGERWRWAADIAPQLELEGRTIFDVTAWAARETGRRVDYASAVAESKARGDVLRGLDRRAPAGVLTLLPHLTGLDYVIREDVIVVSVP